MGDDIERQPIIKRQIIIDTSLICRFKSATSCNLVGSLDHIEQLTTCCNLSCLAYRVSSINLMRRSQCDRRLSTQ